MKEINLFVRSEEFSKVTNIFMNHKVGMTFFDINGTGNTPRGAPEVIVLIVQEEPQFQILYRESKLKVLYLIHLQSRSLMSC